MLKDTNGTGSGVGNIAMTVFPECRTCLFGLASEAAALSARGDNDLQKKAESSAREIIESADSSRLTAPEIANTVLRELKEMTGVEDPYLEQKRTEMSLARKTFDRLRDRLGNDLHSCLALAALGNSVDFFKTPQAAFEELETSLDQGFEFYHNDADKLEACLEKNPGLIVYLTDNAGEVYFDLPLFQYLDKKAGRTVLVVKGGPGLNDLTRIDLDREGLTGQFPEISHTGTPGAGIDWNRVSPQFLELIGEADLILSKGMANFETLPHRPVDPAVLFLFKAKCRPVQDFVKAPPNSYWALWKEGKTAC